MSFFNPYVAELYHRVLGEVGGEKAHALLHTGYRMRKRIADEEMDLSVSKAAQSIDVNVCFGTGCFLKGSQKLLGDILEHIRNSNLNGMVNVSASFCFEACDRGPVIRVCETKIEACTKEKAIRAIDRETAHRLPRSVAEKPLPTTDGPRQAS
jgi:NADH-quinone oxidoreductase subunit G